MFYYCFVLLLDRLSVLHTLSLDQLILVVYDIMHLDSYTYRQDNIGVHTDIYLYDYMISMAGSYIIYGGFSVAPN